VVRDPSEDGVACSACHEAITTPFASSMHAQLTGERNAIAARTGIDWEDHPDLSAGFDASCNGCHATCGQCHVSRPNSVEGGFVSGHVFERTPSMINQCVACHGSRVGEEFRGVHRDEIDGYQADVHYLASMRCEDCHTANEMHTATGEHRYAVDSGPMCEDCHADLEDANSYHSRHMGDLSCQVCHSQDYKQCASCHTPDGLDGESELGFKIGLNPLPETRSATYVTLRHAPVVPDSFAGWGYGDGLPGFDTLPTFKYATPHNIQRWTTRTTALDGGSCATACHDTPATSDGWFLRQSDLDRFPDEADANRPFIVPDESPLYWGE
jgi:hypothetical protein